MSDENITQWEYKQCHNRASEKTLNELGDDGWSLICSSENDGSFVFKRPKQKKQPKRDDYGYSR